MTCKGIGEWRAITLTTNQDTLTGTTGNDTFVGGAAQDGAGNLINTLQSVDSLDGGAGVDTIKATVSDAGKAAAVIAPTLKNIENVQVRFVGTQANELSLAGATGVQNVTIAESTSDTGFVSNVGTIANLAVKNQNVAATFKDNTATTLNLGLDTLGTKAAPVTVTLDNKATTLAVTANNAYVTTVGTNGVTTLSVAATGANKLTMPSAATAATVTGAGSLELATPFTTLKTLDASANTGGVTATVNDKAVTVTGGAGADKITYTAAIAATAKVDLGAGNDTLTLGGASLKGAVVNGGDGVDTLAVTKGAHLDADSKAIYTGFEVLQVSAASGTEVFDPTLVAGITSYKVAASAGAVELKNLAAAPTVTVIGTAADLTLTLKDANGAADSATVTLDNGAVAKAGTKIDGVAVNKLTAAGVETLNIHSNGTVSTETDFVGAANSVTLATLTTSKVVIDGSQAVSFTTGAHTATLTVDATAATGVVTVDASKAVGLVNVNGGSGVATLTTGSGNDIVGLATKLSSTVKAASVTTGAGDDLLFIKVDNTAGIKDGKVSVDAGEGKDTINLTIASGVAYDVKAGAGDDTVVISGTVKTTDKIDGGAGTDTVSLAGKAKYVADDYIVLNKVLKNFEAIEFTSAAGSTTAFDASQVASYKTFTFDEGGQITKVAADQALVTADDLTAHAAGYVAGDDSATPATTTTYAGSLNVTASGGTPKTTGDQGQEQNDTTVNAFASSIALTAKATTVDSYVGLTGDVKSAAVTLVNSVNSDTAPTADTIAHFDLTTATTATKGAFTALGGLTSLTLSGNGSATVVNAANTALTTVDASQLGGVYTLGASKGAAIDGLTYNSANAAAETIKLGSGLDHITLGASTYGKVDTVTGLNLVLNAAGTALDVTKSDTIAVTGVTSAVKFTTSQTDLDLALKDAAAYKVSGVDKDVVVFNIASGADAGTYIYHDVGGDNAVTAADTVVKLVGTVDLDSLVIALG